MIINYLLNFLWTSMTIGRSFDVCNRAIGLMSRVFANGLGDWGSIPGRVIPKTQKMVLDAPLLNTQYYKVRIKGKVEWLPTLLLLIYPTSLQDVTQGQFSSGIQLVLIQSFPSYWLVALLRLKNQVYIIYL